MRHQNIIVCVCVYVSVREGDRERGVGGGKERENDQSFQQNSNFTPAFHTIQTEALENSLTAVPLNYTFLVKPAGPVNSVQIYLVLTN